MKQFALKRVEGQKKIQLPGTFACHIFNTTYFSLLSVLEKCHVPKLNLIKLPCNLVDLKILILNYSIYIEF